MATTAFLLWSSAAAASSSSSQEKGVDGGPQLPPENPPPAESPSARPRARKSAKASAAKRPPQRGLGVAQLERLRLQERWKKMTEIASASEAPLPAIHFQIPVCDAPLARCSAPVAFAGPWGPPPTASQPAIGQVHRCWPPAGTGIAGYGSAVSVRSVLHDQYAVDRYRAGAAAGEARFPANGTPFSEHPSNQRTAMMQCFSDQCEFCARKKLLFGDSLPFNGTNGVDYFEMDLAAAMGAVDQGSESVGCVQRNGKSAREREVKEFEFFPPSQSASKGGGDSELENPTVGDAASSSSAAAPSTLLDLSLKLSF